jgi:hypothetical protein
VRSIPARSSSFSEARKPAVVGNRIGYPLQDDHFLRSRIAVVPCVSLTITAIVAKEAIDQTRFAGVCRHRKSRRARLRAAHDP